MNKNIFDTVIEQFNFNKEDVETGINFYFEVYAPENFDLISKMLDAVGYQEDMPIQSGVDLINREIRDRLLGKKKQKILSNKKIVPTAKTLANQFEFFYNQYKNQEIDLNHFKRLVSFAVRFYCDHQPCKLFSINAFNTMKSVLDLNKASCKDVENRSKPRNKAFHVLQEHVIPISQISTFILKAAEPDFLKAAQMAESCFITKDEDNRLNERKYRTSRPNGWEACYRECGIEVMDITK